MSKPVKGVPNSKAKAHSYIVGYLAKIPYVKKIYVHGSRSVKTSRKPRHDSDWDIVALTTKNFKVTNPRLTKELLADVAMVTTINENFSQRLTEVYPTDKHNLITAKKRSRK